MFALDDAVDVDTRGVDLVRIEFADLDQLFDFGHADFATAGDHWIEVPRGFSKNQVAGFVALPRLD